MKKTIEIATQEVVEALRVGDIRGLKKAQAVADRVTTADQATSITPEQSAVLHKANVRLGRSH